MYIVCLYLHLLCYGFLRGFFVLFLPQSYIISNQIYTCYLLFQVFLSNTNNYMVSSIPIKY